MSSEWVLVQSSSCGRPTLYSPAIFSRYTALYSLLSLNSAGMPSPPLSSKSRRVSSPAPAHPAGGKSCSSLLELPVSLLPALDATIPEGYLSERRSLPLAGD